MDVQAYPKQIEVNGQPVVVNNKEEEAQAKKAPKHKPHATPDTPVEIGRADGTVDVIKPEDDKEGGDAKPATNQVKAVRENKD